MGKSWSDMSREERNGRGTGSWKRKRAAVLRASDVCWLCGRSGADTVDHMDNDPTNNDAANLAPAHGRKQPWGCPGNFGRGKRPVVIDATTRRW